MHGLRKVILGAAVASLALVSLGAPAAAADTTGTLAIVNGVPGQKIDICIGSKEQSSGLYYGGVYEKDVIGTGARLLRFYKKNPYKTCGGTKIASKLLNVTPGMDYTIVVTKFAPKVVIFDNHAAGFLGEIPPRGAPFPTFAFVAFRSAADFATNFHYAYWSPNPETPIGPAVNAVWVKGDRIASGFPTDYRARLRATKLEQTATVAQRSVHIKGSRRYEWILVGTSKSNAKFVLVNRGVSDLSP